MFLIDDASNAALEAVRMVLAMRPDDDGAIAARLAALKAERRRPAVRKPPKGMPTGKAAFRSRSDAR
jgi:hypothetical protein